jgi:hypothetical protein
MLFIILREIIIESIYTKKPKVFMNNCIAVILTLKFSNSARIRALAKTLLRLSERRPTGSYIARIYLLNRKGFLFMSLRLFC